MMEQEQDFKIMCPFCNAPYTASMTEDLYASEGCETCGPTITGELIIRCSNCGKIIYKKEY